MEKSSTYNYSFCADGGELKTEFDLDDELERALAANTNIVLRDEPDAMNVTEQYNPFIFNVMHSYLAPGKILEVQPQMVAVRDVSFGDYPLNVFTDRGAYALLQGDGEVLYGNFKSVSNLISIANCIPTESGTFFLASGAMWLIAGATTVLVSDAMSLGPHKEIRSCSGYASIAKGIYDITGLESAVPFDEFVRGASLSYDRYRDEIIVSNPDYRYSYVLSLKYRQWHKISQSVYQPAAGNDIVMDHSLVAGSVQIPTSVYGISSVTVSLTVGTTTYSVTHAVSQDETWEDIVSALHTEWGSQYGNTPMAGVLFTTYTYRYLNHHMPVTARGITVTLPPSVKSADGVSGAVSYVESDVPTQRALTIFIKNRAYDLSVEDNTAGNMLVHLQSRPLGSLGLYIHVHRLISFVNSDLTSGGRLVLAIYGSDDLHTWNLLSYAERANVKVAQLRTPSAARSWRYYTITVGGIVPKDTDFGPLMLEYVPVGRRIG